MRKRVLPKMLGMIDQLLRVPSISSANPALDKGNYQVITLLAEWLEELDFAVEIQDVSSGKANLIATLGQGDPANSLIFSGHTDTVPYNLELWEFDPFAATEHDGKIYGLGSTDMKSFFALVIESLLEVPPDKLKTPITLIATADEESSMDGAKALQSLGRKPGRFAIIGEPTGLKPIRMHKGVMMESIRITGQAGHSSNPDLGASALEAMHQALGEILAWRQELQNKYKNPLFQVGVPTLNLGSIHGGDNPNRICGHCETHIDIRPLPGMDIDELRSILRQRLARLFHDQPKIKLEVSPLFDGIPPFQTAANSRLVKQCEKLTRQPAEAVAFGTEAPYFSGLGIDTVILGPGSIDQAHQANEYMHTDQIKPCVELIRNLVTHFCFQ